MTAIIQECAFSAYVAAYDHAQVKSRCAHVACGILVDDKILLVETNTPTAHAEMEALSAWYCQKGGERERGGSICNSCAQDWRISNGETMFGLSSSNSKIRS